MPPTVDSSMDPDIVMPTPQDTSVDLENHPLRDSKLHRFFSRVLSKNEERPTSSIRYFAPEAERLVEKRHNTTNELIQSHWDNCDDGKSGYVSFVRI